MYSKGINHGSMGMKNVGSKLLGAPKGMSSSDKPEVVAMTMITPQAPKKPYNMLEKGKK